MSGWIGVDLDGTLAQYTGFQGHLMIGLPVPAMLARVKRWRSMGQEVRIFTARVAPIALVGIDGMLPAVFDTDHGHAAIAVRAIREWCVTHIGEFLPITCQKDYAMIELWDDRCVQVEMNTGRRKDGLQ